MNDHLKKEDGSCAKNEIIKEAITGTSKRITLGENVKEESSRVNNTRMNPDWVGRVY